TERPRHPNRVPARERGDRSGPVPDRIDEERELARPGETEAEGARQDASGRLEHEELAGLPWVEPAARQPDERVRPHRLVAAYRETFCAHVVSRGWARVVSTHVSCAHPDALLQGERGLGPRVRD